jgi:hypothetical protein
MLEAIAARDDVGWLETWLDKIVAMCDVGQERPLPEDASEYERSQWMQQREEMADALWTAPHKMQAVAQELRRIASDLEDAADAADAGRTGKGSSDP